MARTVRFTCLVALTSYSESKVTVFRQLKRLAGPKSDLADLESVNAVWRAQRFISPGGKRRDAATCYLHPRLRDGKHPNLHVLIESQVNRVLFDDGRRAVGVEIKTNPLFHVDAGERSTRDIKARKLVIESCGAFTTPSLLEMSGVGEVQVIERAGVPVLIELPGVGNGYEDHHLLSYPCLNNLTPADTLDAIAYGRMVSFEDLIKRNEKILGWNAQDTQAKVRPTEAEVAALRPKFQEAWKREFADYPDKPLGIISTIAG
jgi:alcohol oxidase